MMLFRKIFNFYFLEKENKIKYQKILSLIKDGNFFLFKWKGKENYAIDRNGKVILRINREWRLKKFIKMSKKYNLDKTLNSYLEEFLTKEKGE